MARPIRIQYKDAWYHVINRGRRGEAVFKTEEDYQLFLKLLKESSEQWNVNVTAFCLMSNHYHLLIQTPLANLSRFMRHIDGVYTQRFNRKHKLDGQLFRGRYKSILIGEQNYLLDLIRYIHFNPVKAGIVEEPQDYQWSSYLAYQKKVSPYDWIYKQYVFNMLGLKENYKSKKYLNFLKSDSSEEIYEFFSKGNLRSVLGTTDFQDWVKNKFFSQMVHPEIPESKELFSDIDLIINEVAKRFNVKAEDLLKIHRGVENPGRDVAIYLSRQLTQNTLAEIGKKFNNLKYSSVSSAVQRVTHQVGENSKTRKMIHKLIVNIKKNQIKI